MAIRKLAILVLLASCSSAGSDVAKSVDVSAATLAEIRARPYVGGNGPGGFAAAALSNPGDGLSGGIHFTGFGPYLHDIGFTSNMVITQINGVGVADIFADRWQGLRLQDPGAFDAAHYKDLVEYLFVEERGGTITLGIDTTVTATTVAGGEVTPGKQTWRLNLAD